MHYINEYYKSQTYESFTVKENLKYENRVKKRVFQTNLRSDFLERIVRAIRGFTVSQKCMIFEYEIGSLSKSMEPITIY